MGKPTAGRGLTALTTRDLENLLRRLHEGALVCPFGARELHAAGLSYLVDRVSFLHGKDEPAVRAVLVAVLAERRAR